MKEMTHEVQRKLWASVTGDQVYKGDVIADTVVREARAYIGKRILDVGAGRGTLLKAVAKTRRAIEVLKGIDPEPHSELVERGDGHALPYDDATFDTVFCMDVIEHLEDTVLAGCLREIWRVVMPGGYAIFTTVNNEDLAHNTVVCPFCASVFHRWGHVRTFTRDSLGQMLRGYGYELVRIEPIGFGFLSKYGWLARRWYDLRLDDVTRMFEHITRSDLLAVVRKPAAPP